jgi:hypothetical protein
MVTKKKSKPKAKSKVRTKIKKLKGLTLHFMPYSEIENLDSGSRIKKLLQLVLKNKVIVIQGRLKPEEETRLIEDTMALVGTVKGFKGIELEVITPNLEQRSFMSRIKHGMASALIGDTESLTVIGPASVIKEMKKDPSKLEVMMS